MIFIALSYIYIHLKINVIGVTVVTVHIVQYCTCLRTQKTEVVKYFIRYHKVPNSCCKKLSRKFATHGTQHNCNGESLKNGDHPPFLVGWKIGRDKLLYLTIMFLPIMPREIIIVNGGVCWIKDHPSPVFQLELYKDVEEFV